MSNFHAVHSLPLRLRATAIGALTLFAAAPQEHLGAVGVLPLVPLQGEIQEADAQREDDEEGEEGCQQEGTGNARALLRRFLRLLTRSCQAPGPKRRRP